MPSIHSSSWERDLRGRKGVLHRREEKSDRVYESSVEIEQNGVAA
jgi:hypothetical protein